MAAVAAFVCAAMTYNNMRNRHYLTRRAILAPRLSPWRKLLWHGDDMSFLELTGLDRACFNILVSDIVKKELRRPASNGGRPTTLNCEDRVGLTLFFLTSHLRTKHLCVIFGCVPTVCNVSISDMLVKIVSALRSHTLAKVAFPTPDEMQMLANLVSRRENTVRDIIAFTDGCQVKCQCSEDDEEQGKFYNGHVKDTTVNNVFMFCPLGLIRHAAFNFPGICHDAFMVRSLVSVVLDNIGIYKICVDQGFPRDGDLFDIFVGPISKRMLRGLDPIMRESLKRRSHVYTSLRQASEWGMRALQGSFARLTARLTVDKKKRHTIIYAIILLHNFRTRVVGLNQIATVFNPHYEQYINFKGYDKINRYYVN